LQATQRRSRDFEDQAMLSVQLFGTPLIRLHDAPLDVLRRKNRALMYFISAHPQPVSRDQVLAQFWPDHERGTAQNVFRTMLHEIRKVLGNALIIERELLCLASSVFVDARAFESGITTCGNDIEALSGILALYRGDFLDGFTLVDTPAFDDWVASERERYRLLAIRGFASLARLREDHHERSAALAAVESALRLDPLQEDLHRTAMRLRYHTGDRTGAIRQFEALRRLLDDELGVTPMPETRALYDAIITDRLERDKEARRQGDKGIGAAIVSLSPCLPVSLSPVLAYIGRTHEFDLLQRAVGDGKLALIEGEPGIGKTRLAEEFAARQTALVLRGTAHELEQSLPYQPVIEALRSLTARADWPAIRNALQLTPPWLSEAARIVPELAVESEAIAASPPNESQVWESILRLLQSLSQRQRVILFLDDVQWADATTLGLIGYLARRNTSPALFLLCITRAVESKSKLAGLIQSVAREGKLARIQPPPLSSEETAALAGAFNCSSDGWLTQWLAVKSEGNPFFATELLRFAKDNDWLGNGAPQPAALTTAAIMPETIRDLIASRMNHLSESARRALDIAAVIGREFNFDLIVQVSQSDEISVLDACDELRAAALVQPGRDEYFRFDHSLTLDVALREMGATRHRALNRRVAEALERMHGARFDAIAGVIAQHYLAGNAPDRAAPYALRAGQLAASVAAWAEAIAFFEQALSAGLTDEQRVNALIGLGEARFHSADFARASEVLHSATETTKPGSNLERLETAYELLTLSLLPQGRYAEALALNEALLRSGPSELASCAEMGIGVALGLQSANPAEAERHLLEAERLLAQPRSFKSRVTLAKLRYQRAGTLGQQGKTQEATALYWEALNLVRQDETAMDLQRHILLYNNLAYQLHLLGDPSAADYASAGLKFARDKGSLAHQPYLLSTSGEIALARGDLDAAERFFAEGLSLAKRLPIPERIAGLTANLGLVAIKRGWVEAAIQRLREALDLAGGLGAQHLAVRIRIALAPLLSRNQALALLREAREIAAESGFGKLLDEIAASEQALDQTSTT
jgi:DNA-binding SARP family transcriptional activator/tetratricopeptide (TPR) repeat protein